MAINGIITMSTENSANHQYSLRRERPVKVAYSLMQAPMAYLNVNAGFVF